MLPQLVLFLFLQDICFDCNLQECSHEQYAVSVHPVGDAVHAAKFRVCTSHISESPIRGSPSKHPYSCNFTTPNSVALPASFHDTLCYGNKSKLKVLFSICRNTQEVEKHVMKFAPEWRFGTKRNSPISGKGVSCKYTNLSGCLLHSHQT